MGPLVLDISRLISRAGRSAPTGIDRVEMAYAQHLIAHERDRLIFAAMTPIGRFGLLPKARAEAFVKATQARWRGGDEHHTLMKSAMFLKSAAALGGEALLHRRLKSPGGTPTYLLVSHHHLDQPASIMRLKAATGARFVPLVHDLIPMEYPEYAREKQPERHAKRMRTVARLADAVIANSAATAKAMDRIWEDRHPPVTIAHIGFDPPRRSASPASDPYFVYVSTIEPRKNHLLLFNLWRQLKAEMGASAPKLHIIGRRGWKTEGIVDMLDRSDALDGVVVEHADLSDAAMEALLIGARALLFPAFAEGFGLPLAEALARGVPAVASDLPALREVGGAAPDYLDPLDGPAWRAAVADYSDLGSGRRTAQLARLRSWQPPTWEAHFAAISPLLA